MQIQLQHDEIEAALVEFIATQGFPLEGKKVSVEMKAGRGDNGYTAVISIVPDINVDENEIDDDAPLIGMAV